MNCLTSHEILGLFVFFTLRPRFLPTFLPMIVVPVNWPISWSLLDSSLECIRVITSPIVTNHRITLCRHTTRANWRQENGKTDEVRWNLRQNLPENSAAAWTDHVGLFVICQSLTVSEITISVCWIVIYLPEFRHNMFLKATFFYLNFFHALFTALSRVVRCSGWTENTSIHPFSKLVSSSKNTSNKCFRFEIDKPTQKKLAIKLV